MIDERRVKVRMEEGRGLRAADGWSDEITFGEMNRDRLRLGEAT